MKTALGDLPTVASARDLGCNAGFFTVSLALEGIETVGIDPDPVFVRTVSYVIHRVAPSNASVWQFEIRPSNISLLPRADLTVFLSLWHHFVRGFGLAAATEMLREIWSGTGAAMFFETGEDDMAPSFGLPQMKPTPKDWIESLLSDNCTGGEVRHLGEHVGFYGKPRNLFIVVRQ